MNVFAIMLDGPPSAEIFERQLELSVYVPTFVMLLSWILVRWRKEGVYVALVLAAGSGYWLLREAYFLLAWGYPYSPSLGFKIAPWISALLPFVAIILCYSSRKKTAEPAATAQRL